MIGSFLLMGLGLSSLAAAEEISVDQFIEELAQTQVGAPGVEQLQEAAVRGLVGWLAAQDADEAPQLMVRSELQARQRHEGGARFGLGMGTLILPGYGVRVLEVFPGTPAAEADLSPGDVIIAAGGERLQGLSADAIRGLLRAGHDEPAILDVLGEDGVPRRIRLAPAAYVAPSLSVSLGEDFRLLRFHHFGEGCGDALASLLDGLGEDVSLVLDLRDTRDGLLQEVADVASLFVPGVEVLGSVESGDGITRLLKRTRAALWRGRVAVLVNGGTAGLAELLVGALRQGRPDATLVGTRTGGSVALYSYVDVGSEHVLRVVGSRLTLADGSGWGGKGFVPDVQVNPFIGSSLLPPPATPPDLQVDAALRLVTAPGG